MLAPGPCTLSCGRQRDEGMRWESCVLQCGAVGRAAALRPLICRVPRRVVRSPAYCMRADSAPKDQSQRNPAVPPHKLDKGGPRSCRTFPTYEVPSPHSLGLLRQTPAAEPQRSLSSSMRWTPLRLIAWGPSCHTQIKGTAWTQWAPLRPIGSRPASRLMKGGGGGASHCSGVREEEARASGPSPWYCDYDCRRSLHRGPTGLDSAAQTGEEAQPRPVSGPVPYPQGSGGLPPRTAAVRAELALLVEGTYQLSPTKEDSPSAPNDAQITKARLTAFVDELPRSGAGKKNRKTERPIAEGRGAISLAVV